MRLTYLLQKHFNLIYISVQGCRTIPILPNVFILKSQGPQINEQYASIQNDDVIRSQMYAYVCMVGISFFKAFIYEL